MICDNEVSTGEGSSGGLGGDLTVAVCVKWAALHVEIDPLQGVVHPVSHDSGFSEADLAATETALRLAEKWTAAGTPTSVVTVCVGPVEADDALRGLLACGVSRAIRIEGQSGGGTTEQLTSSSVAGLLANEIIGLGARFVVCGDVSADRGSGSVPAFLAHRLEAAQALGLIEAGPGQPGTISAVRRLDGARRELLNVSAPAVISVEGSVGDLRRATLPATIAARSATIELRPGVGTMEVTSVNTSPWRPRTRVVPAPASPAALDRIAELTGARSEHEPALTLHLDPPEAARVILDQLDKWGYLDDGSESRADVAPSDTAGPSSGTS